MYIKKAGNLSGKQMLTKEEIHMADRDMMRPYSSVIFKTLLMTYIGEILLMLLW